MTGGIIKYKDYIFWIRADEPIIDELSIKECIANYLVKEFPNCRIYWEFNRIDLYVVEKFLPVEIQSTPTQNGGSRISDFEDSCMDQIEENIYNLGICQFFMDTEFLRYLQNDINVKRSSIQLDWLYNYMKEERLKVFTIDYRGNIQERTLEDFAFISDVSVVRQFDKNDEKLVLEKNKYDVLPKVLKYFNVAQDQLETKYSKKIENIFFAMSHFSQINNTFEGNFDGKGHGPGSYLGIFESEGRSKNNRIRFVDHTNIAQYFPAYIRNKEKWDKIKGIWMTTKQIEGIIKGTIDYNYWEKI